MPVLRITCGECSSIDDHSVRELQRFYGHEAGVSDLVAGLRLSCGHDGGVRRWEACTQPPRQSPPPADDDTAIDAALAEFNGDARATIRALLHDIDALAADARSLVSRGFVRDLDLVEWRRRHDR